MKFFSFLCDFKKVGELTKKFSNLPDSYIKRSMEQIFYKTPKLPNYLPKSIGKKKINFTTDRSWSAESRLNNLPNRRRKTIYVQPIKEWTIFKGDKVEILNGKDKGKQGIVSQVFQERNWVNVEGLNLKMKVIKKEGRAPAVISREEQPLRVTDQVALVDPSDMLPCKAEWRFTETGDKVRISKRSGRIIPVPVLSQETYDYKTPSTYQERDKDTTKEIVSKITFQPKLCTFEMDIMKKMSIEENREPAPAYWY